VTTETLGVYRTHCVSSVCLGAGEQSSREKRLINRLDVLDVDNPQTHEEQTGSLKALSGKGLLSPQSRTGICFDKDDADFPGKNTT